MMSSYLDIPRRYGPLQMNAKMAFCLLLCSLVSCSTFRKAGFQGVERRRDYFTVAWSKNLDPPSNTGNLPIALNAPLIYGKNVYIGDNSGVMRAYSLVDGREVWSGRDRDAYHAKPVVSEGSLIYGDIEGRVYARDMLTGELQYAVDLGASIESEAIVHGGRAFFHTRNHQIFALDAKTGKILWSYKRSISQPTTLQGVSRPTVHSNKLFVGFADGTVCAFSLEEGMVLWEKKVSTGEKFIDVDMEPVVFGGHLYVGSSAGDLHVFNADTGNIVKTTKDRVARSPRIIDQNLVYSTTEGGLVALDGTGKEIKRVKLPNAGYLGSAIAWRNGIVVPSIDGTLYLLDRKTFRLLDEKFLGHAYSAVFGSLAVGGNSLAVFSSRNRLYVYR